MSKRVGKTARASRRRGMPAWQRGMLLALALMLLGMAFGMILVGGINQAAMWMNAESRRIEIRRQRAMAVVRVMTAVSLRGMIAGAVVVVIWRGAQWMGKQASTIYAREGLFPVVKLRTGPVVTLHDINRNTASIVSYARQEDRGTLAVLPTDRPGQLSVVMGALAVQHEAAKARVEKPVRVDRAGFVNDLGSEDAAGVVEMVQWPQMVDIRQVIESPSSLQQLALGVTVDPDSGRQIVVRDDMARLVHVAVGGSSGFGKSVFLRSLAYQLATAREKPNLALIDLENVTLSPFADCDRLMYPIADTESAAASILRSLSDDELNRRQDLFSQYPGVDSLGRYNAQASDPLPAIIVIIDEATALLEDSRVSNALRTLTLRARKYGLWVVMAGQDWKASSLPTTIRNQLSTTIQFKARDATQSRVLLGVPGAEALPAEPKGRALARLPGRGLVEIQAPYISRNQILSLSGGGPQRAMPMADDGSAEIKDQPDASDEDRVRLLAAQGCSLNEIQRRVFGGVGGNYYYRVKEILGDDGSVEQ